MKYQWTKNRTNTEEYTNYNNDYHDENFKNEEDLNFLNENLKLKIVNAFKKWATKLEIQRINNPNLTQGLENNGQYSRDMGYKYLTPSERIKILKEIKKAGGYNNPTGLSNLIYRFYLKDKWIDIKRTGKMHKVPWQTTNINDIDFVNRNVTAKSILDFYFIDKFMYQRRRFRNTEMYQREIKDLIDSINEKFKSIRKPLDHYVGIRHYNHFDKYLRFYSFKDKKTNQWCFRMNEPTGRCWIPILTNPKKLTEEIIMKFGEEEIKRIIDHIGKEKEIHKHNQIVAKNEYENLNNVLKRLKELSKQIKLKKRIGVQIENL